MTEVIPGTPRKDGLGHVLGLPPDNKIYPGRILMMCHGDRQQLRGDSILCRMGVPLTVDVVRRIKTIDIEPDALPTVVADVSRPLPSKVLRSLGKFDAISVEFPPTGVVRVLPDYKVNDAFFDNACKLLAGGGILGVPFLDGERDDYIMQVENHHRELEHDRSFKSRTATVFRKIKERS